MRSHDLMFTVLSIVQTTLTVEHCDIESSIGTISGFINPLTPHVKQWLGVPYAEPPINSLRFLPPIAKSDTPNIDATKPPPSCQQYRSTIPDVFTAVPEFLAPGPYNEDCLYLNVIAPSKIKGKEGLPVLVWIHGGMTLVGGINTPYEKPEKWVQRSQEHIIVQINYRLNIFGFPNAKGLDTNNVGLLDQRFALEWVRANIKEFGGDPERIIMWGQSAGAASADALQFAFKDDPIFKATIFESGVALIAQTASDPNKTSFGLVAKGVGCTSSSPIDEVDCMRKIDAGTIEKFIQNYTDSRVSPVLYFSASADGKLAFLPQEIVAKGNAGEYANLPMLVGSNAQEGSSFVPFSPSGNGITPAVLEATTLQVIQCKVAATCRYRQASNRTTFRYLYGGNFTDVSPLPWLGAYHFSELPLIMGTYGDYRGKPTPLETQVSHTMQDFWLAFAKDPEKGLLKEGWTPYSANGEAEVFARDGTVVQKESVQTLDGGCLAP